MPLPMSFRETNYLSDVMEKFFSCIDVTEGFPFLVPKLPPFYDRWTQRRRP
jgi:hypothetical protein